MKSLIEVVIELEFFNEEVVRVVYESVRIEYDIVLYRRMKGEFVFDGRKIRFKFIVEDNFVLWGIFNFYLWWIKVVMDFIEV